MNRKILTMALTIAALWCAPLAASEKALMDRAARDAVAKAVGGLGATDLEDIKSVAVTPLWQDPDGYVTGLVKSSLTQSKYAVLARSDEEWRMLMDEMKWDTLREDVMAPDTVQKFGRIKGCDAIVYGTVRETTVSMWSLRAGVRLTLNLADVETGQILWSSGPVEGEAWEHWATATSRSWQYPALSLGFILVLCVVVFAAKMIKKGVRPL